MNELLEIPCVNCSSELNFDADKNELKCLHCHSLFPIEKSKEIISERSISELNLAIDNVNATISEVVFSCKKCGQQTSAKATTVFFECKSCGNNVLNSKAYKEKAITPSGIIPFSISKNEALQIFQDWVGIGFWNDSDLKKLSLIDKLIGHYIPFWTFDTQTDNQWSGESGTYYYTTESYTNQQGNQQTRQVQHTQWQYASGQFERFFDDVLICGNKEISEESVSRIYPFELEKLIPLNEKYTLGWDAQAYDKDIIACKNLANEYMTKCLFNHSAELLATDTYRGLEVKTTNSNEQFKHVILPIWLCEYQFKGKNYNFLINGQTGKIDGKKPLSVGKIVTAVVIGIALIIGAYLLFAD